MINKTYETIDLYTKAPVRSGLDSETNESIIHGIIPSYSLVSQVFAACLHLKAICLQRLHFTVYLSGSEPADPNFTQILNEKLDDKALFNL